MTSSRPLIGVFMTDTNLIVRFWDSAMVEMTGLTQDHVCGQCLTTLLPALKTSPILARFQHVLTTGKLEVLAPMLHPPLIPCPVIAPSRYFTQMQQHLTIAPWREQSTVVGTIITIEDITTRLEHERDLMAQVTNSDDAVRLQVAQTLATSPSTDASKQLLTLLGDKSWRVRRAVVEGLSESRDPGLAAALIRILRDNHQNLSLLSCLLPVLVHSQVDIVPLLIECAIAPDVDLRIYAVQALGERSDQRVIPVLLEALQDTDENVRFHAIEALGHQQTVEAVEALLAIAEARDFFLAFPALDALSQMGIPTIAPRLLPLLQDDLLCTAAANALAQLGDAQVTPALAQQLNQPNAPILEIAQALATLYTRYETELGEGAYIADLTQTAIDPVGVQALLETLNRSCGEELRVLVTVAGWLKHPAAEQTLMRLLNQPLVNQQVVEILVKRGSKVVERLLEHLKTDNGDARRLIVEALGRIGDRRAVLPLLALLETEPDLTVYLVTALGQIGDRRAYEALLHLLSHPLALIRQATVAALNSLKYPELPRQMESLLDSTNPHLRESAAKILGYFASPDRESVLLSHCHDSNERVRVAAIEAIPYLESAAAQRELQMALQDAAPKVRAAAARALGQIESAQVSQLLREALQDADTWVRYYTVRSIGLQADSTLLPQLLLLAEADEAFTVRLAAIEAIGKLGGSLAVSALVQLATAPQVENDIDRAILSALGRTAHPNAILFLIAALKSTDAERCVTAMQALSHQTGTTVVEQLQHIAATDKTPRVCQAAIATLALLETPSAVAALVELTAYAHCRTAGINALAKQPIACLDVIAKGLAHDQLHVRHAMIKVLQRFKHPTASDYLYSALTDVNPTIRLAVVVALIQLGNMNALRRLTVISQADPDPLIRQVAQTSLTWANAG